MKSTFFIFLFAPIFSFANMGELQTLEFPVLQDEDLNPAVQMAARCDSAIQDNNKNCENNIMTTQNDSQNEISGNDKNQKLAFHYGSGYYNNGYYNNGYYNNGYYNNGYYNNGYYNHNIAPVGNICRTRSSYSCYAAPRVVGSACNCFDGYGNAFFGVITIYY